MCAHEAEDWVDEEGWFDPASGLPLTNRDQTCAFCTASRPRFAHRIDPDRVRFRVHGDGYALPAFWCVCERRERFVTSGDDAELLRLMREVVELEDALLQEGSLAAFRAADLGAATLRDWP